jgi:hypothetical protein|tara:strand:- start:370 stop:525 length:156 start_codon:yes stop_codon:yes gene_type:complete
MKYRIKVQTPRGSENWVDFSLSGDKEDMQLHLKWVESYYKDDIFKLVKENK